MLPQFTIDGVLPRGDFKLTISELKKSILVNGSESCANNSNWDKSWRMKLVENLEKMVMQLNQVGISEIFVDGSFAEDKDHPNDIDGYFVCDRQYLISGNLERDLNLLDPHKSWTWDPERRHPYPGYPKRQLPMWHAYRVELYPHFGQIGSGIKDQFGNELDFPSAFRLCRRNDFPKGIIRIGGPS